MKTIFTNKKMMLGICFLVMAILSNSLLAQVTVPFTNSGTWTCPTGVTSIKVECWGGGGGGGAANTTTSRAAGGGGGGSYVVNNILAVVPGTVYTVTVGAGGITPSTNSATSYGLPGGKSEFSGGSITPVTASGGTGGGGANLATTSGSGGKLGGVYGFTIASAGSGGYSTSNTTVTLNIGTGASAAVSVTSGALNNISTINQGTGYTSATTVSITSSLMAAMGATAIALVNSNINAGGTITLGLDGTAGIFGTSGGAGGAGGNGGAGGVTNNAAAGAQGATGGFPGGGGTGGYVGTSSSSKLGGVGGAGQVIITYTAPANTNYYFKGTGALNDVSNWGLNTDGTGANPPNFTSDFQTFNVRNTSAITNNSPWTVSGANSKIIVGDATLAPLNLAFGFI
jgi:hypothetical protein